MFLSMSDFYSCPPHFTRRPIETDIGKCSEHQQSNYRKWHHQETEDSTSHNNSLFKIVVVHIYELVLMLVGLDWLTDIM